MEDRRAIQIGGAVKIAIVFGDNRRERKLAIGRKIATGVVGKEGIAPRHFRRAGLSRRDDNVNAVKRVGDVVGDCGFVHGFYLLSMVAAGFQPEKNRLPACHHRVKVSRVHEPAFLS